MARLDDDLALAHVLADTADSIAMARFKALDLYVESKPDLTPVSDADTAVEKALRSTLARTRPRDGVLGEEYGVTGANSNRQWVIDPIDGTNNFIAGLGNFAVCIGLLDQGMPVLGAVYDVTRDTMYAAAKGEGAWVGTKRMRALDTPMSDSAMLMLTSNLIDKTGRCPQWACQWLGQTVWKTRILGSAALEAIYVAAGVAHGAVTVNGKLWDAAAPAAILLEAGATMTDLSGNPIFPFRLANYAGAKVPFLAAGPAAHRELLQQIRAHP